MLEGKKHEYMTVNLVLENKSIMPDWLRSLSKWETRRHTHIKEKRNISQKEETNK